MWPRPHAKDPPDPITSPPALSPARCHHPGTVPLVFPPKSLVAVSPAVPPLSRRQPSEYIEAILELSTLVVRRHHRLLHHPSWLYRLSADGRRFARACATVHAFTADVVQRRRRALNTLGHQAWLESHQGRSMDFIDLLLLTKVWDGDGGAGVVARVGGWMVATGRWPRSRGAQ